MDAGDDPLLQARVLDWLSWARGMHRGELLAGIELAAGPGIAEGTGTRGLVLLTTRTLEYMRAAAGQTDSTALLAVLEAELAYAPLNYGPRGYYAEALYRQGELRRARALLEGARDDALAAHQEHNRTYWLYLLVAIEIGAGDLRLASRHAVEGIEAARDARDSWGEALLEHGLALTLAWRGQADQARAVTVRRLVRAVERHERPWIARLRHVLGLVARAEGDPVEAAAQLTAADDLVRAMGFRHPAVFRVLPDAVEAVALAGGVADARGPPGPARGRRPRLAAPWVDAPWPEPAASCC